MYSNDPSYILPLVKFTACTNEPITSEMHVFGILDTLKVTAEGYDRIPAWFLRMLALICSRSLAHLINTSICTSHVPERTAIISPVPKVADPKAPADYRPISVVPKLSRLTEQIIVHKFIYPAINQPPIASCLNDQFAFRRSGSTTAAIIKLLQQITTLLLTNDYVLVASTDFSKAFDRVRHDTLLQKISCLDLPDQIYNWIVSYFTNRKHVTRHLGIISSLATINASIVQGSVIRPASYIVVSSDLHPLHSQNVLVKYADDTYLFVGSKHISTANAEFQHISDWARCNNLHLNQTKTREFIVFRKGKRRTNPPRR